MKQDQKDIYKLSNKIERDVNEKIKIESQLKNLTGQKNKKGKQVVNLTYRHKSIIERNKNQLNIHTSLHAIGIQRSNYL